MKILVTGGTGYVGAHIVSALVAAGHDLRLLVRRPEQVAVSLEPFDVSVDDVVVGNVLDERSVVGALTGCDAVVHAAAVFSLDPRRADEVLRTNQRATELVLGEAARLGLDPIVHISSTVALTRHGGSDPSLPLGDIEQPYAVSKRASEQVARDLQAKGLPIVSVYPGAVYGPHDPYLGDQLERLTWVANGMLPLWPGGGCHYVDVRDVARVVAAVMQPGQGPRRFVVPGHHVDAEMTYRAVSAATGSRRPHVTMPGRVAERMTWTVSAVQRHLPPKLHMPADHEGVLLYVRDTRFDDSPAREQLGVDPIPFEDSVRDSVRWLAETGHLRRRVARKVLAQA